MNTTKIKDEVSQNCNEIVAIPYKILQEVIKKQISGRLTIQDPNDQSVQWQIYLGKGKVNFASSMVGKTERLAYLLSQYLPKHNLYIPQEIKSDYEYICHHWQNGELDLHQTRKILAHISQEALLLCLALPRAALKFEKDIGLNPLLLSLNLQSLVLPIKNQIRYWVNLRSEISSPFVRPIIEENYKIYHQMKMYSKHKKQLEQLEDCFKEHCSFYEIGTQTNKKTLDLAMLLQPIIIAGGIKVLPYQQLEKQEHPLIACIDDSQAIQRIVKMTLKAGGFDVINITEPAKAISTFVRQKPDLILMDINMPEIDGYKLAYMLRQSALLKDIPIMMLTGRDGVLDRVKAKMVGAVGYVCKPFNPQELIQLVHDNLEQ